MRLEILMKQSEFMDKVEKKIDDKKVKDYVDDLETQPKELKTNIPDNPFMVGDGSDGIDRDDELTTKQSMMFFDYLKRKGFKDFGEWWYSEGKEKVNDIYSEAVMNNDVSHKDWWNKYLRDNLNTIIDRLRFMQVWGDSIK